MLGGGGGNRNTMFPGFVEENRVPYDNNTLPQLQLFGHVPIGAAVGTVNCMGNGQAPTDSRPINRVGEGDTLSMQQKLHISLNNNFCQDEAAHIGTVLNPNPVSTGLKLSCEEEERNSSVTSACENMKNNLPAVLSLGREYLEGRERDKSTAHHLFTECLGKRHQQEIAREELEIESMNRKNKELGDRIKQVAMESQSWHYRAKYNESVVNVLKSNIQQLLAQGTAQAREGSGDSEVDDAVSCSNHQRNR
ncbi:UNVERIFIED_CONTAM: hypothetical protein Sradi_4057600 [Sesamum radiatum]|uniref:Uncharacterized protein n=1 Tax=Sesamum radiatum TaxID=300843 RepID=A0AAW2PJS4_SESRA